MRDPEHGRFRLARGYFRAVAPGPGTAGRLLGPRLAPGGPGARAAARPARVHGGPRPGPGAGLTGPTAGRGLTAALVYLGVGTAVVGSLGALLIPTVSAEFDVSRGTAQWTLTITLLVGAVTTPVLGALSDRPRRRTFLLVALALVVAGGVLAATATTFGQLLAGRALQGLTYGMVPAATAIARAHLPPERLPGAIAALAVSTVTGAGLSFPVTGIVVELFGLRAAFALAVVLSTAALVGVAVTVPGETPSAPPRPPRLDVVGALLLGSGLAALLLAISLCGTLGWAHPLVLGLACGAVVVLVGWVWHGLRVPHPLVRLRLLRHSAVASASAVALVQGAMLFAGSSAVSQLVQTPASAGYGFGLSLVFAGLVVLPSTVGSQVSGRIVRVLLRRFPAQSLLLAGPTLVGLDLAFLAFFHDELWQVAVGVLVQGLGIGVSFVVMPVLILRVVPAEETGSAIAFNQVLRTLGGSVGSALTGA
ncbi:MFS transporter, partial [Pseudonocardia pini]|uniref:MFS transporter n=1 Tax=Pseudonocardia pini TaxID=2758030 RepID=UPI0015F02E91